MAHNELINALLKKGGVLFAKVASLFSVMLLFIGTVAHVVFNDGTEAITGRDIAVLIASALLVGASAALVSCVTFFVYLYVTTVSKNPTQE